jgi:signal transduction histidine kinase
VLLERHDDRAVVVVEDDGRGFDVEMVRTAALPSRKLGLLGIEERAALVGGTLTIESRPRAGTAVFVDVPLARERNGHGSDPYR